MTKLVKTSLMTLAALSLCVPGVQAYPLAGTVALAPAGNVIPGLATGPAGTLLASTSQAWVSSLGTSSGTLVSAVYMETGSGTLDFYYQLSDNTTATNCGHAGQPGCDPLSRLSDTDFSGFLTSVGFRIDGSTLPGGIFVNGTVAPNSADRNGGGNVVGFNYNPLDSQKIQPGQTGNVVVISTNATNYKPGFASVIDGGTTTVASFQPAAGVPEPATFLLIGAGFVALGSVRRLQARRGR